MMTVGAYEAKTRLSELLDEVSRGGKVVITRHGVPVAVLQPAESVAVSGVDAAMDAARQLRKDCAIPPGELREWLEEGRK